MTTDVFPPTVSLLLSVILLALSLSLVALSIDARMPWAMVGGLIATSLMALALIVAALRPAGWDIDPHVTRPIALTLRFVAVLILAASAWTLYSRRRTV